MRIVDGDVYVSVHFRKSAKLGKPKAAMTVDINFDTITLAVFKSSEELEG